MKTKNYARVIFHVFIADIITGVNFVSVSLAFFFRRFLTAAQPPGYDSIKSESESDLTPSILATAIDLDGRPCNSVSTPEVHVISTCFAY